MAQSSNGRRSFSADFKARVARDALRETDTLKAVAAHRGVHLPRANRPRWLQPLPNERKQRPLRSSRRQTTPTFFAPKCKAAHSGFARIKTLKSPWVIPYNF